MPVESICVTPLKSKTRLRRPPLINCGTNSSSFAASPPSMSFPRSVMTLVAVDLSSCRISSANLLHLLQDFHKLVGFPSLAFGRAFARHRLAVTRNHITRVNNYLRTLLGANLERVVIQLADRYVIVIGRAREGIILVVEPRP